MTNEIKNSIELSDRDLNVIERGLNLYGKGMNWLAQVSMQAQKQVQDFAVAFAEKAPEVAKACVTAYEKIEVTGTEVTGKVIETLITSTERVSVALINKVDFDKLISHGIQHDLVLQQARMKEDEAEFVKAEAKAKVAETEAQARLLEAQNEQKREERYAQERLHKQPRA